jgi:molybdopterin synthase catalytic subunit
LPTRRGTRLTRRKIDPAKVLKSVARPQAGAVVLFLGTVRDMSEAGPVDGMQYEAYGPMAEKALLRTEEEVRRLWPRTKAVKITHRVGDLDVGDLSVAVAVSAAHRADAFEACRHAIEAIKHDVPIWKRERLRGGKEVWVAGTTLGSGVAARPRRGPRGRIASD